MKSSRGFHLLVRAIFPVLICAGLFFLATFRAAATRAPEAGAAARPNQHGLFQVGNASPWDVNGDGVVNVLDIILIGAHFGQTGAAGWIPEDVNQDGSINVLDITLVGAHFGETTLTITPTLTATPTATPPPPPLGAYVLLGWNDLGMHCYNRDFQDLAVLPPYNNLWAQVIRRGDPPQIVTSGVSISYSFPENTYSVGKSNFWTYAQSLFGVSLAANIGLTGKGLAGQMDLSGDHFVAQGIPLTEYNDSDWVNRQPFQLASLVAKDSGGNVLATNQVVAPVSTEMRCDNCHHDGGVDGISTGKVETNILTYHDREEETHLMTSRPVLCASCHSSNALGAPGVPGLPSLSNAMHSKHAGRVPDSTDGCYNCHPGPTTKCLRDVMSSQHGMNCTSCHGGMNQVKQNANPWLNEPRCDNCHTQAGYQQNDALYRHSTGHGGVYCEACHDSTHAIAPSTQPRDAIKMINLQGYTGTLNKCTVCHLTQPLGGGPHH